MNHFRKCQKNLHYLGDETKRALDVVPQSLTMNFLEEMEQICGTIMNTSLCLALEERSERRAVSLFSRSCGQRLHVFRMVLQTADEL